jgi:hypothetical protein
MLRSLASLQARYELPAYLLLPPRTKLLKNTNLIPLAASISLSEFGTSPFPNDSNDANRVTLECPQVGYAIL